ncbi:hypothetical protein Dimus_010127 [Dionaea muscipula]
MADIRTFYFAETSTCMKITLWIQSSSPSKRLPAVRAVGNLSSAFRPSLSSFPYNELPDYLDHLLQHSNSSSYVTQIHARAFVTGSCNNGFLAARFISLYSRFGLVFEARKVFQTIPCECNSVPLVWNSILRANFTNGYSEEAVRVYLGMRNLGVLADGFTFPLVIQACASIGSERLCGIVHSHFFQLGFQDNLHVANESLVMYGKLGRMDLAEKLFDKMPVRSHLSWNMMLSGYAQNYDCVGTVEMFRRMEMKGWEPNVVSWTSLLSAHSRCGHDEETLNLFHLMRSTGVGANGEVLAVVLSACADLALLSKGEMIHGYVVKGGFEDYLFVKNSLICVYGKLGGITDAKKVFLEMGAKNIVSWNSLITAYTESGLCDEALETFLHLEMSDDECKTMRPNVRSWSCMISGFASKGRGEEALGLFRRMQVAKVTPNAVTVISVLSVCSELAAVLLGRELHGHTVRVGLNTDLLVSNGLINMYTKCGSLNKGCVVFEKMIGRDLISWNSILAGYGMHGYGDKALETFEHMVREEGLKPDGFTFTALISACSHAGLVAEGRQIFNDMTNVFGVEPGMDHYACMVDLLSRAGFTEEASELISSMPMRPNAFVWGALLNSSKVHKNAEIAEEAASNIISLEPETGGAYMLLSHVYAASGRWDDSARVRLLAKTNGVNKTPGQSWIEIKNKVYAFSSGRGTVDLEEIYQILEDLGRRMEDEGYVPDNSFVYQDVGEDEKRRILKGHSEKLAIAFGHCKLPPSIPIRIMKNLRVCGDCHNWTKFFSKITGQVVIVRDSRRFHHFKDGQCSCRDYW